MASERVRGAALIIAVLMSVLLWATFFFGWTGFVGTIAFFAGFWLGDSDD